MRTLRISFLFIVDFMEELRIAFEIYLPLGKCIHIYINAMHGHFAMLVQIVFVHCKINCKTIFSRSDDFWTKF